MDMWMALKGLPPRVENRKEADLRTETGGLAATSSNVAALVSNNSPNSSFLFCHINGTSACGTLKTRWK
jgi:hypothetical protein